MSTDVVTLAAGIMVGAGIMIIIKTANTIKMVASIPQRAFNQVAFQPTGSEREKREQVERGAAEIITNLF